MPWSRGGSVKHERGSCEYAIKAYNAVVRQEGAYISHIKPGASKEPIILEIDDCTDTLERCQTGEYLNWVIYEGDFTDQVKQVVREAVKP